MNHEQRRLNLTKDLNIKNICAKIESKILAVKKSRKNKFGLDPSADYQKNPTCWKKTVTGNEAWTFHYNHKQNASPQCRSPESPTIKKH
jgi:hypothetical protein